jgi:predicted transcriptional regulator
MKSAGYSKNDIAHIFNLDAQGVTYKNSASILARIESNGTIFSGELAGIVRNKIHIALSFDQKITLEVTNAENKVISIQDRIKALAEPHIIVIDDEIHSWYYQRKTKIDFSLYAYLQRNQLNAQICNYILLLVSKIHNEHNEMLERNNEQLNEAYAYLPNASKKAIMKNLIACMEDIKRFIGNTKASKPRKPRKKKLVPVSKQINRLNYQREFTPLKIKSIDPTHILGASQVVIFNTKTNYITHLLSDPQGFTIKGTTIYNINEKASTRKKVRKPEDIIEPILTSNKLTLGKLINGLKTKTSTANGRINEDTILLKALK